MKRLSIFTFIFLFIILGPDFFLKSGFFYNLDSVFFPVYSLYNFFYKTIFFHILDLGKYLNYELLSKFFLILTLFFGVFFGYKSSNYVIKKFEIKDKNISFLIQFLSIVFAISNPFIYERLMSQVGIAIGVFFIGIGFIYLLEYLEEQNNKNIYLSSLFFGLSFTTFPHAVLFIFIIFFITLAFFYKNFSLKNIFISAFIFLLLNLNWLFGQFFLKLNQNGVSESISSFNQKNIEVFVQNSQSNLGVELTSFLGYGFWGEKYLHIYPPEKLLKFWFLFAFIIFFIIGVGAYNFYKKDKKIFYYFLSLYLIFYILALGISSPIFSWFNQLLYDYVPYYIGMREPGKFLGMLAILNTIFFSIGVYYFGKYLSKKKKIDIKNSSFDFYIFMVLIFVFINAYNPGMLWGFRGQLQIAKYPEEYFESKKFLEEKKEYKNLILPWHTYVACQWGGKKVFSNTYSSILNFPETIKSDNIEMDGLYTNSNNPISKQVEKFIETKDLEILKNLGVQNIIFQDKCGYFEKYLFLEELDGLKKVFDKKYLKIYKIKNEEK